MLKKYSSLILLLFILAIPSLSHAESDTTEPTRTERPSRAFHAEKEEFKDRLRSIHDENKRTRVENLNNMLNTVNKNYTNMLLHRIEKMEDILKRMNERADKLTADGTDTTAAKAKLTAAQTAITTAKAAVIAQAAKDYTIDITDESAIKENVSKTREQLHSDLKAVRDLVKAAREALHQAGQALQMAHDTTE